MFKNRKAVLIILLILAATFVAGRFSGVSSSGAEDRYYEVLKNFKVFGQIYREVTDRYIEEIDADKFMRAGINGMLDHLDPYTVYLEQDGRDELQIMTRGKYYGVGMRIVQRNDWATVSEQPFPDSPAFRAGIREGDRIIEIDGKSTKGQPLSETARRLRGTEKGSEVAIKIKRVGEEKLLSFTLIRDEISVSDVQYSGYVKPGIGLIKLAHFSRGADDQVREAITRLKDQGLDGLILDLRGNPGGLLDMAVAVAENFVAKGEMVVSTKGRWENTYQEFRSGKDPILGSTPLVVLVDGYSASASEIVAGAIQDLDRGVIIGAETFGKGLVQTVVPLDRRGDSQLKITTAQYFVPSGRLIQRPDVFERGAGSVFVNAADSAAAPAGDGVDVEPEESPVENRPQKAKEDAPKPKFYTKNHRVVLGGGGITPDVEVHNFELNRFEIELIRRSIFFNFSLDYVAKHPNLSKDFQVTDQMLADFFAFTKEKNFDYNPDGMAELEKLEKIAREEQFYAPMASYFQGIRKEFESVKEQEKEKSKAHLAMLIKREVVGKLFGRNEYFESMFASDSTLAKAMEVLKAPEEYRRILNAQVAVRN